MSFVERNCCVVKLTIANRVLNGIAGMTFIVDSFGGVDGDVAHVRDYRYPGTKRICDMVLG